VYVFARFHKIYPQKSTPSNWKLCESPPSTRKIIYWWQSKVNHKNSTVTNFSVFASAPSGRRHLFRMWTPRSQVFMWGGPPYAPVLHTGPPPPYRPPPPPLQTPAFDSVANLPFRETPQQALHHPPHREASANNLPCQFVFVPRIGGSTRNR